MKKVVLSQPMFFPWVGMFEQLRLADVFIFYDDVQFSKGSFTNRVQVKTPAGPRWLTLPLRKLHLGQLISAIQVNDDSPWRQEHRDLLAACYRNAPYYSEMQSVAKRVYTLDGSSLCEIVIQSMRAAAEYFGLLQGKTILYSSALGIGGHGWQRVLDIVRAVAGDIYITGHGARHYLDHAAFEQAGIQVEYMAYRRTPYSQLHGPFDPHVTILDLIANQGASGRDVICSGTIPWREFINQ